MFIWRRLGGLREDECPEKLPDFRLNGMVWELGVLGEGDWRRAGFGGAVLLELFPLVLVDL